MPAIFPPECRQLLEHVSDAFVALDAQWCCLHVNARAAALFGREPASLLGRPLWGGIHPGIGEAMRRACEQAVREHAALAVVEHDGPGDRWFELRIHPSPEGVAVFFQEVTAQRQAEDALRSSEARLQLLLRHFPGVLWMTDRDLVVTMREGAVSAEVGRRVLGARLTALFPPGSAPLLAHQAALEGRAGEYEVTMGERVFHAQVQPLYDGGTEVIGTLGVAIDITERVRAERRLQESEQRHRLVSRVSDDVLWELELGTGALLWGEAMARSFGYGAEEVRSDEAWWSERVHPDDRERVVASWHAALEGDATRWAQEYRFRRADGSYAVVQDRGAIERGEGGAPVRLVGAMRDVSEQRAAELELRALFGGMRDVVLVLDRDGVYRKIAPTTSELLLGPPEELLGRRLTDVAPLELASRGEAAIRQVLETGEPTTFDYLLPVRGQERWFSATVSQLDADSVLWVARDTTEVRAREQQLRRAERLASVGTLIGGVAHELNNPLTAIKSFAQLMLTDQHSGEDQEALEIIRREAERAAKIVADLRLLARQTQGEQGRRERVDLNEVIRHVAKLRRYTLATANIELREDLAAVLPAVWADRADVEQIVLNLLVNAEQALAGHAGERCIRVRTRPCAAGAALHVIDSGPGIRPEHLSRVFDPFFTTKDPGEGTGLGLSLVHSIVDEHGGRIHLESELGHGAAFLVELPVAAPSPPPEPRAAEAGAAGRALRVLLVDDEEGIRRAVSRLLERRGHRVDQAADGAEALRRMAGAAYDVIVSDLRMPGLGGDEFLIALLQRDAHLAERLVIITGDAANQQSAALFAAAGVPVISKPFELDAVARAVEGRAGNPS